MQTALYPKPIEDKCPYCGSENVSNDMTDCQPTASGCSVQVNCADCGKVHHLNYEVASISLENDKPGDLVDYHVGYELPDMGADDQDKAEKLLVAAVKAGDGICIMAKGYGDGASANGYGCPVIIELCKGQLRVITWDDINNDDAGPIVELGGARYSEEDKDAYSDHPYCGRVLTPSGAVIEEQIFQQLHSEAIKWAEEQSPPWNHTIEVRTRKTGELHHRIIPNKTDNFNE